MKFSVILVLLQKLAANLVKMMLTETMILWLLKKVTEKTATKWDDHGYDLVVAVYKGDDVLLKEAITNITDILDKKAEAPKE